MLRRLFKLLFGILLLALIVFCLTSVWIMFDGLSDEGKNADVAVVPGHAQIDTGAPWPILKERLDEAVRLYNDSRFPLILVCGEPKDGGYDEAVTMADYLKSQGIPAKVVSVMHENEDTNVMVTQWANQLKEMPDNSTIMIISHYYQIARLKLALRLAGVDSSRILHSHVGHLQKADAYNIAREVVAFYQYLYQYYLLPQGKVLSEKVSEEAKKGMEKAQEEAHKAKESVDKKLDNLPK